MRRPADWHAKKSPRTFTANSSSHSSSVASRASWLVPRPALFTRMSRRPNRLTVSWTARSIEARSVRSSVDRRGFAAGLASLRDDRLGVAERAGGGGNPRPGRCEREDEVATDAAARAGHERHLPVEVESRNLHQALILSPEGSQSGSSTTSASTHSPKTSIETFVPRRRAPAGR